MATARSALQVVMQSAQSRPSASQLAVRSIIMPAGTLLRTICFKFGSEVNPRFDIAFVVPATGTHVHYH